MAIQYVFMSGTVGLGSMTNIYVNSDEKLATFDGSVRFEDIKMDGEYRQGTMRFLGFIVIDENRAVVATFSYLSLGQPPGVLNRMQEFFNSMRIARSSSGTAA